MNARFNQVDIQDIAPEIIGTLLTKIEAGGSPEKIAENDYLMKCELSKFLRTYDRSKLITNVLQA